MRDRIGMLVDLQGAENLYKKENSRYYYHAIDNLLATSTKICEQFLPEINNRLFAHQIGGDGIFIISESTFNNKDIPLVIVIIIMQTLLLNNYVCKAGIATGEFSDIQSCLPQIQHIIDSNSGQVDCGGLMTKFNVMGTALINSYRLSECDPRGSRLLVDSSLLSSNSNISFSNHNDESVVVDWIHSEPEFRIELFEILKIKTPKVADLEKKLIEYTRTYTDKEWVANTLKFNGINAT